MSEPSLPPDAGGGPPSEEAPRQVPRPSKLDWRLIAVLSIAVLFLVAAYVNRRYYARKATPAPEAETPAPSPTAPQPAAERLSPAEQYARLTRRRELEATDTMFVLGERTFIIARPPTPVPRKDDPKKIENVFPGRLFDLSRCAEGVRPQMFHRRFVYGGRGVAFMDTFAPLGVDQKVKMVVRPAGEVTLAEISDPEPVIGVAVGGEARAYPIKLANYHDVINDTLGGKAVVIAWSAIASAPSAMERTLPDGTTLVFGSAGLLFQGANVLYDTKTLSLWSPVERRCVAGELADARLEPLQATLTSWHSWKGLYPDTSALVGTEPTLSINYDTNVAVPSATYYRDTFVPYPVYGLDISRTPLPLKTFVIGVTGPDGESFKAYPIALLREVSGPIEDTIGGQEVSLEYDANSGILTARDAQDRPLLWEQMFWFCWAAAHPETEVWQEERFRAAPEQSSPQPSEQAPPGTPLPTQPPSPPD